MGRHQHQQVLIETRKGHMREVVYCFGEGLSAGLATKIGVIGQMRKKTIEFGLDTGLETGYQSHQ